MKDLARPPSTPEDAARPAGILKTTPKYQGLPKADPGAARSDSAEDPQFRQSGPTGAPKQAQIIDMCSNDAKIVDPSRERANQQEGGGPHSKTRRRWQAKITRRRTQKLLKAKSTVEEANAVLQGLEANLAALSAQDRAPSPNLDPGPDPTSEGGLTRHQDQELPLPPSWKNDLPIPQWKDLDCQASWVEENEFLEP